MPSCFSAPKRHPISYDVSVRLLYISKYLFPQNHVSVCYTPAKSDSKDINQIRCSSASKDQSIFHTMLSTFYKSKSHFVQRMLVSVFARSKLESMEMKLYERILLIMSSKEQEGYGCGFLALLKMFEIGYQDFGWNFISICSKGQTAVVCLLPSGFCPKCLILNFEWALSSFFSKVCRTYPCSLLPGSVQNVRIST